MNAGWIPRTMKQELETGPAVCGEAAGGDEPFRIETRQHGAEEALLLAGLLDVSAAALLRTTALRLAEAGRDVAIDWSQAEHISAGALQVLLALGAAMAGKGKAVRVAADNPDVRGFLELAGLSARFPAAGERP